MGSEMCIRDSRTWGSRCGARGASVRTRALAPEAAFSRICDAALAGAAGLGGLRQRARRAHVGLGRAGGGRVRRALRVSERVRGVRGRRAPRGCGLCGARGSRCTRAPFAVVGHVGRATQHSGRGGNHRTVQEFRILQAVEKSSLKYNAHRERDPSRLLNSEFLNTLFWKVHGTWAARPSTGRVGNHRTVQEFRILQAVEKSSL